MLRDMSMLLDQMVRMQTIFLMTSDRKNNTAACLADRVTLSLPVNH